MSITVKADTMSLSKLHRKYVRNTPKDSIVEEKTIILCSLTSAVCKGGGFDSSKVYIKTRVLKHIYDKRPAQFYDLLLYRLGMMIRYPNFIYKNKGAKRGSKCLVKELEGFLYIVVLEEDSFSEGNFLVTSFQIEDNYLRNYEMIWSWGGDNSHRNTFDATIQ